MNEQLLYQATVNKREVLLQENVNSVALKT